MVQKGTKKRNVSKSAPLDGGATTVYEADLWAMADALRGSMDSA